MEITNKCKQLVESGIIPILQLLKDKTTGASNKIISCFYQCFKASFLQWAHTAYATYPTHFIEPIAESAFTDSVLLFTQKANEGSIYAEEASLKTIIHSFYKFKLMEHLQTEKRLAKKQKQHQVDYNRDILLLEDDATQQEMKYERLEKALQQLSPEHRQIITWRHIEQKSPAQIALLLGISTPSATNSIYRCMERLRILTQQQMMNNEN